MYHALIIIAYNLIIYFKTLRFTLITDDIRWYKKNENGWGKFKDYKNIFEFLAQVLYSGGTFGMKWEKKFGKYSIDAIQFDHLFTIFLHTTISVLIYIATGSFWGAILYSCNPVNNQTSIWLNGRRYAINIILVLLSLIAWNHHAWFLSIPLWGMTSMFQLTALFAPILWGKWWLLGMPLIFIAIRRHDVMTKVLQRQSTVYSKELLIIFPRRIIVVIKSYGFYFFHMIFPGNVGMYYPNLYYWGLTKGGNEDAYAYNMEFYKGALAGIISIVGIILLPNNLKPMGIFAAISLLQWCNIIYAVQTLADRYCNMANVFLMVFLAMALDYIWPPLNFFFVGYYIMGLQNIMRMYPNIWHFHKYHLFMMPESLPNWVFFSNYFIKTGQYLQAWPIVEEGLGHHPNNFGLLFQAAQCWKGLGNKKEAMKYLMRAKENYYDGQEKIQGKAIQDFIL